MQKSEHKLETNTKQAYMKMIGETHRRSLHESQQQVSPAATVAAEVSVSDAEERLAGDVGGPTIRS